MTKRSTFLAAGAVLLLALAGCAGADGGAGLSGASSATPSDSTIGVALPNQTSQRWVADGKSLQDGLEKAGYAVDLQDAGDDSSTQSRQVDQMISKGDDVLLVAAVDGTALGGQLARAARAGVRVISFDRLIRGTGDVDFHLSFDDYKVGVAQATSLLTGLGLLSRDGSRGTAAGPFTVELFAGPLGDTTAATFFSGATATLKPFLDAGVLKIVSGQTTIEQCATVAWDQRAAQTRMEQLLTSAYGNGATVNAVLSPYDGVSRGIITALQAAGYGKTGKQMPIISGWGAEIASVTLIADGVQYATIFEDPRALAGEAVVAVRALLAGSSPQANDTRSYDNEVEVVPAFVLPIDTVYQDNLTSVLVDSGFYTRAQVRAGTTR